MPLQGRILPIELEEGDHVTAGQVVARMDQSDLETDLVERRNTVMRYDKNLAQIDLAIEQAAHTVKASQAKYDFAERVFSRTRSLRDQNSASVAKLEQDELQLTQSALDLRKEQLNHRMYQIMRSVMELMRETDVAKQTKAERDRGRAEIHTPVAGVALKKEVANERVLAAGSVLLEIGDPRALQVEADVLTQDVTAIKVGDPVEIEGPAIGTTAVAGTVAQIYPQGFTKVSSLGVEQQRVKVVIDFAPHVLDQLSEAGRALGVDYRVHVRIFTESKDTAVVVPRAALFRSAAGDWQLFAVRQGRADLIDVTVGLRNDFDVEILKGINVGEEVILAPDSTIEDGTLVEF
jgi:HlyD family secretion protein